MAIEEPAFDLLEKDRCFELRHYQPVILAEVLVEGDLNEASNRGFRLVADYIFGNNRSAEGSPHKVAMTAPVVVEPRNEKIAMTAPVGIQELTGEWRLHFVMPSRYTMATLPAPNNPQVMLREVPRRKMAVVRFSGVASASKTAKKTDELYAWMATKGIQPLSAPELARYNPPWTLPFLRRNEVMAEYD